MSLNGHDPIDDDALDLSHEEQTARIYTIVRSDRTARAEQDMAFGRVAAELSRNTDASVASTSVSREIVTALKQLVPRLAALDARPRRHPPQNDTRAEVETLPGMRRRLDSYVDMTEVDPADNTGMRDMKAGMLDMTEAVKAADRDRKAAERAKQEAEGEARLAALELDAIKSKAAALAIANSDDARMKRAKNWTGLAVALATLVGLVAAGITWLLTRK